MRFGTGSRLPGGVALGIAVCIAGGLPSIEAFVITGLVTLGAARLFTVHVADIVADENSILITGAVGGSAARVVSALITSGCAVGSSLVVSDLIAEIVTRAITGLIAGGVGTQKKDECENGKMMIFRLLCINALPFALIIHELNNLHKRMNKNVEFYSGTHKKGETQCREE